MSLALKTIKFPPAGTCTPQDLRALVEVLLTLIAVEDLSAPADAALVTIGKTFPSDPSDRARRVHFVKDSQGCVSAIEFFCQGQTHTFERRVIGEVRHFPPGLAPEGWVPADGTDGVINLKQGAPEFYSPLPEDVLIAHVYNGVL